MKEVLDFLKEIKDALSIHLFSLGKLKFTLWNLLYLSILTYALFFLSKVFKNILVNKILSMPIPEFGVRQAIGSIVRYFIVFIGLIIIFQTVGLDLSTLTIIAGALGVGIGFGLQNITNNLVSGLIILFERPIKVGDRIEVGGTAGDVIRISPRATTIVTNDNIAIIVPNSEFISSQVINWSYIDREVRFNFPIGVSYKHDPEIIRKLLLEVATENPGVMKTKAPDVLLESYGDSSIQYILRVWTSMYIDRPGVLRSQLNYAINKKFKEHGIEIPFPQRDLHVRSGVLTIRKDETT